MIMLFNKAMQQLVTLKPKVVQTVKQHAGMSEETFEAMDRQQVMTAWAEMILAGKDHCHDPSQKKATQVLSQNDDINLHPTFVAMSIYILQFRQHHFI